MSASPPAATSGTTKAHVLEDDGVALHLYGYLFRMQRALRTSSAHAAGDGTRRLLGLPLPDTVVYEHDFPQAWFTYDRKTGEIIKMPGRSLDARVIHREFCTPPPNCGNICAQYSCAAKDPATGRVTARTTYLTPDGLEDFLHSRDTFAGLVKEGVLQRFVPPRGEHNEAIEAVWSPHVTQVSRRANIHRLHSRHVDARSRASTFDALPHLYIETLANESTQESIIDMIGGITERLLVGEHKNISRFVGLFKQDRDGQLWFLHATSIRVEGDALIGASQLRGPLELLTKYEQPPSSCTDEEIVAAHAVEAEFKRAPHRRSPSPRRLAQSSNALDETLGASAGSLSRRRSVGDLGVELGSALPDEARILSEYIDDALYALYASRITLRSAAPVAISVPPAVAAYLGAAEAERLLVGILDLVPAPQYGAGVFVTKTGSRPKPLSTVRQECDELLQRMLVGVSM